MNKCLMLLLTILFVMPLLAQEETLIGDQFHGGVYGGPVWKLGLVNGKVGMFSGGRGGWIINHRVAIGGGGYSMITDVAPFAMPVLPVETFIEYQDLLGLTTHREERNEIGMLPQHFADMSGWENMVATVAKVYQSLSLEEQSKCVIYVRNYGEAGAIDFFGEKYGLPKATCAHNNYWLWGRGDGTGEVVIIFGITCDVQRSLDDLRPHFEHVEYAVTFTCKYCMPYENNRPIFICRTPKGPITDIQAFWGQLKYFD